MFNTRVFALSILSNEYSVDIVIGSLVARNGSAWSDVGEKVEGTTQSQVEGDMTFPDGRLRKSVTTRSNVKD